MKEIFSFNNSSIFHLLNPSQIYDFLWLREGVKQFSQLREWRFRHLVLPRFFHILYLHISVVHAYFVFIHFNKFTIFYTHIYNYRILFWKIDAVWKLEVMHQIFRFPFTFWLCFCPAGIYSSLPLWKLLWASWFRRIAWDVQRWKVETFIILALVLADCICAGLLLCRICCFIWNQVFICIIEA